MTLYNIQKRKIVWNRGRLRGLTEANERIGDLVKECEKLLKTRKKIRVLEVGCGYAKILLELKKIFGGRIETHGINLEKRWKLEIVKKFALSNKLCSNDEFKHIAPKIHIADVGVKIPFKSKYFDLIFSQASVQYIHDKALFLEETNRVLTERGIAIIELDEFKKKHPLSYKNLFEIWKGDKEINPIQYIRKYKNIKAIKSKKEWHVLRIKKVKNLNLKLKLITSFNTNDINKEWWGTKAIYIMK